MDGTKTQPDWPERGFLSKNGWIWNGEGWIPNEASDIVTFDVDEADAEVEGKPAKRVTRHASELEAPAQAAEFAKRMNAPRPVRGKPAPT